jgi:hypothetical protein
MRNAEIHRPEMSPRIAVAKIYAVCKLTSAATGRGTRQSLRNGQIGAQALYLARSGQTTAAFRHLALAKVPAGSITTCCGLHSAQYGCATHGYPRSI